MRTYYSQDYWSNNVMEDLIDTKHLIVSRFTTSREWGCSAGRWWIYISLGAYDILIRL